MRPGSSNRVTPLQAGHWLARWSLETWSWRGKKKIRFLNLILAGYLTSQLRIVLLALLEHLRNFFVWMVCLNGLFARSSTHSGYHIRAKGRMFDPGRARSTLSVPSRKCLLKTYTEPTYRQATSASLQNEVLAVILVWVACTRGVFDELATMCPNRTRACSHLFSGVAAETLAANL